MDSWDSKLYKENSKFYLREFQARTVQGEEVASLIDSTIKQNFRERFADQDISILDVPCGNGRISIPLAKLGYKVTGLDYSQEFLDEAHRLMNDCTTGRKGSFYNADMHNLENSKISRKKFNFIINYWTSFGYGSFEEDLRFFSSLRTLSFDSTILLVESWHRENVVAFPISRTFYERDDILQLVYNDISPDEDFVKSRHLVFEKRGDNMKKLVEFMSVIRLYSANELKSLLNKAGWRIISENNTISDFLRGVEFSPLQDRIAIFAEPMKLARTE